MAGWQARRRTANKFDPLVTDQGTGRLKSNIIISLVSIGPDFLYLLSTTSFFSGL